MLITICVPALAILAGLYAVAAPILPGQTALPPEVRSLAKIDKLEVLVEAAPGLAAVDANLVGALKADTEAMLRAAGIEPTQGGDLPRLNIVILTNTNSDFPDAVTYTYHLALEQNVTVDRLKTSLFLPTYALVHGEMTSKDKLVSAVKGNLSMIVNRFITRVHDATTAAQ